MFINSMTLLLSYPICAANHIKLLKFLTRYSIVQISLYIVRNDYI